MRHGSAHCIRIPGERRAGVPDEHCSRAGQIRVRSEPCEVPQERPPMPQKRPTRFALVASTLERLDS
jgi:hypothetical protein